jgi:GT2 family glycosyltransferase
VISVLIYSEHDPAFLERCLGSLRPPPLPFSELEILILDSGTSTARAEFAERLVSRLDEPFRWLPSDGETQRTALYNRAIHESQGDILVFTHDDAYFPDDWLPLITAPLGDPEVGCASGEDQIPSDERSFLMSLDYVLKNPFASGGMRREHGIRFGYFTPRDWNMAFSKQALLDVGLFDSSMGKCAEAELVLRIRKAGYKVVYVPECRVFHSRETTLRKITRTNFQRGFARSHLAMSGGFLRQVPHSLAGLLTIALPGLTAGAVFYQPVRFWLLAAVLAYAGALLLLGVHAFTVWRRPSVVLWTPILVMSQHFGHGLGYLLGFLSVSHKSKSFSKLKFS